MSENNWVKCCLLIAVSAVSLIGYHTAM